MPASASGPLGAHRPRLPGVGAGERATFVPMRENGYSRTAMMVAMRRAAHQLFDARPLVLDDPCAVPIIGPEAEARLGDMRPHGRIARVGRAFMVARSRFAEEALAKAVRHGVHQYVVLGAGLDTFAYRNPFPAGTLRVFEVDHPATQAWKREKLAKAGIPVPADVTYVPVDFERRTLAEGLAGAGFDPNAPAFFSWLGVVMYLSEEAIATTFRYIAARPAGSGLALDYSMPAASLSWVERIIRWSMARRVAKAGEPFRSFFTPATMRALLERAGLKPVEDLGPPEMNARYFRDRTDGLRTEGRSFHVVSAEVMP